MILFEIVLFFLVFGFGYFTGAYIAKTQMDHEKAMRNHEKMMEW